MYSIQKFTVSSQTFTNLALPLIKIQKTGMYCVDIYSLVFYGFYQHSYTWIGRVCVCVA